MSSRRLLPRILFLVVVIGLFGAGGFLACFQSWRAGRMIELAARSEIARLSCGDMEYVTRGNGPSVLVFHSAPGGYDQSLALAGFLEEAGFQIIAPSRPGYLRTPLATGPEPQSQAEAAVQLLDRLDISQAAVIGFGWGGAAAVEFVRHFPDRTAALILVSAATAETPPAPGVPLPQALAEKLGGDSGSWGASSKAARSSGEFLGVAFDLTSTGDPANRSAWIDAVLEADGGIELFQDILLSLVLPSSRESGLKNDLLQPLPSLQELKAPVLLVHGGMDKALSLEKTERGRFKPAELFLLPEAGHLVLLGPDAPKVATRMVDFLNQHSPKSVSGNSNDGE